ncbi:MULTISPECIES: hypothetical protein [Pseudomonas]|uniref:hypothetical protein n=1 Tax=Pseudomonas TaxID=286 RepID=UPI000B34FB1B|nr:MULTISPECIES: hypothetical protein [Pseudomonas]PMY65899.1 hypothetical protein C1Y31_13755 [Pseudomonas sp. FW305-25]PMY71146.1 hypothetical protein C1Y32_14215 [Pseudomonas sp. FW126-L8]PNA80802.1 hypothetical protein C1Y33_09545 [Pseudomonas sp. FW305-76]
MNIPNLSGNTAPSHQARYYYGPNYKKMTLAGLVFGGLSLFAVFGTPSENNSVIRLIEALGLNGHLVMQLLGVVGVAMTVAVAGALIFLRGAGNRYVVLTDKKLVAPVSNFSSKIREIRLINISDVELVEVFNQRFIRVQHSDGKMELVENMFKNQELFYDCYKAITLAIEAKGQNVKRAPARK